MAYELATPPLPPKVYTAADREDCFATLLDLGQEYVMNRHWPTYERLLANARHTYAEASTAKELEELLRTASMLTKRLLVEKSFKAYRQGLRTLTCRLGLDPGEYKLPPPASKLA